MAGRQLFAPALLLGSLALSACAHPATAPSSSSETIPVRVAVVADRTLGSHIDLSGSVSAADSVNVGAISAGRVIAMNVRVGDRVQSGQVLAEVDAAGYRAQLAQAQSGAQAAAAQAAAAAAQASAADAQVATARSQLHLATVTAARMSMLYREGAISKQDYDQTQANLAAARAAMQQAASGYSAARAAAAAARANAGAASAGANAASLPVSDAIVRAPFSGVVTARMLDVGAVVGPGAPIVTLENDNALELDVALPNDAGAVAYAGESVPVRVDALGGATLRGTIRAIAPSENPALRSSMLRITIPSHAGLSPGMYARVSIPVRANGLAAPTRALITRAGQSGVFALHANTVRFIPVEAGSTYGQFVRIQGKGLRGARVAVSNLERLTDGASVTVTQ